MDLALVMEVVGATVLVPGCTSGSRVFLDGSDVGFVESSDEHGSRIKLADNSAGVRDKLLGRGAKYTRRDDGGIDIVSGRRRA